MNRATRVTKYHVRVLRNRLSLTGMSIRELARKAGVSKSVVHTILRGEQFESRYLPNLLEAVGIATTASMEHLRLEAYIVTAVRTFVFNANLDQLRFAVSVLDALSQHSEQERLDNGGNSLSSVQQPENDK